MWLLPQCATVDLQTSLLALVAGYIFKFVIYVAPFALEREEVLARDETALTCRWHALLFYL